MVKVIKESMKMLIVVAIVCIAYKLKIIPGIVCLCAAVVFNLALQKEEQKRVRMLNRFKDVVLYMEQMIYSFKKQPKIRPALIDAQKVGAKQIKELVEEAVVAIDIGEGKDIYSEALDIIEGEFECKRIKSLHKFLIKIEKHGGDYENYINILLEDIKAWNDRTLLFINNVSRVKRNVLISIFSTLITCGFLTYLVPRNYSYTSNIVYQIGSMVMILIMMFAYWIIIKKLNFNWIKEKPSLNDNYVMGYYTLVEKGYRDYDSLNYIEKLSYKKAKRRMENELSKVFPDWIRDVAINLQNDTVQSAIENSYEDAPFILKRPIRKLLLDFEKYPIGIEPYNNLLKEFALDDIKSSMKMFYSINELGKEQSDNQINSIIDRNNKLANQAEEMKNNDHIGAVGMYSTIPMLIGVVKVMIDMVLMIIVFTSSVTNVVNGG